MHTSPYTRRVLTRCCLSSATAARQVVSLRLPADDLERFLPQILEGCLLWAEDSKNKFRAKVGGALAWCCSCWSMS